MKCYKICFSPTGGTKKVTDTLTKGLASESHIVDLTDSRADFSAVRLTADDIAVIAVPSYGGRVPVTAVRRLSAIDGNGAKAILLCVYGNRAYEDTLVKLRDVAADAGFHTIAAVAAVAEHSIARQFAAGRPDTADQLQLRDFSRKILEKLSAGSSSEPSLPGSRPYKELKLMKLVPVPDSKCTKCGLCAEKCPVQAIDKNDPVNVKGQTCISCMRCIAVCPASARDVDREMLAALSTMLSKAASDRKEYQLYL